MCEIGDCDERCAYYAVEDALRADRAYTAGLLRDVAQWPDAREIAESLDDLADRIERGEP